MGETVCLHNGTVLTGFTVMENCAVLVEDGFISDVFSQKRFKERSFGRKELVIDVGGAYIAPGFIDTHTHGTGGYGTEDSIFCDPELPEKEAIELGVNSMLELSKLFAQRGVTAFNPTLYPSPPELMLRAVKAVSSAIGKEEGPLLANGEEVAFQGGAFRRVQDGVIAGSGLTMIRGVKNLVDGGLSLSNAVKTASFNPAQIMGYAMQGAIIPGRLADITVFDKDFDVRLVMVGGKIVKGDENATGDSQEP